MNEGCWGLMLVVTLPPDMSSKCTLLINLTFLCFESSCVHSTGQENGSPPHGPIQVEFVSLTWKKTSSVGYSDPATQRE